MREPNLEQWKPARRETALWKRVLAAVAVVTVVLGWRLAVSASGWRLQNIGRELVAVNMLVKYPVPNHAGSQVLFAKSTSQGVGIYLLNTATGQQQTIYELTESRILSGRLLLLDWAPDDTMLAYAKPAKDKKQQVVLCSSLTGTKVGALTAVGLITQFRWLSPNTFAYLNDTNNIYVVARNSRGKWIQSREFKGVTKPPIAYFSALSTNTLVWKQAGAIWTLDVASGQAAPLWKPATNQLIGCYFSREKEQLIVSAKNRDRSCQVLGLDPRTKTVYTMGKITDPHIIRVNWVNAGKGFAYQSTDHWGDSLFVRNGESAAPVKLFPEGEVLDYKTARDKVFIDGSEGNEPPGVWEYNVGTGTMRCLVASTEKPFSFARTIKHTWGTLTNGSRVITYQAWSPFRISKGKPLPLILGNTPYRWNAYPYLAAAAGCQFVTVNRENWEAGFEQWKDDVMAVHSEFAKRKDVDLKRVFLYGHSAETIPISNLAASRPDLWKGVLIFSPTELPDLSKCRLSSLLIDAAELERGQKERVSAYQTEAAKVGVGVKLVVHPGALHTSWSRSTEQAKVAELAEFLSAQ